MLPDAAGPWQHAGARCCRPRGRTSEMSRRRRRRRMSRAQTRVWSAAAGLLVANWAWQTHPVWTVAGAVLVIGAGAAMLWRRRAQLRAPGERTGLYRPYDRAGSPVYYGHNNDYP